MKAKLNRGVRVKCIVSDINLEKSKFGAVGARIVLDGKIRKGVVKKPGVSMRSAAGCSLQPVGTGASG